MDSLQLKEIIKKEVEKYFLSTEKAQIITREEERHLKNKVVLEKWLKNKDFTYYKESQKTNEIYNEVFQIPKPKNRVKLKELLGLSSARLGVWRSGVRPLTQVVLKFIADHAVAKKAVYEDFSSEKVKSLNLLELFTEVKNKEEFLLRPDLGQKLTESSKKLILEKCVSHPDVQVIVSDGLSGMSLKANIEVLLPELMSELSSRGLRLGTPIYCKYGRVYLQDRVSELLHAKASVILIGERPGLGTGDSLSAYIIYNPGPESTHANRNCISNIHDRGFTSKEAAKMISWTLDKMFEQKTSGVNLELN